MEILNLVEFIENKGNRGKWRASIQLSDRIQYRGLWKTKKEAERAPAPMLWKGERDDTT